MAPKATAQAKAARLQMRGLEMSVKADYITVCHALKNRPDVVSEVKKQLKSLGVLNADDEVVENASARPALGKVEHIKQESASPAGKGAVDETDWERELAPKSDLMSFGAHELSSILYSMEPATFSKNNQKPFVKKGCKHPPKNVCLEIIEYCTEHEPMTSLGRGKTVGMIKDRLVELNALGGRRARDFQPPLNWDTIGYFAKLLDSGAVYIEYRLTGARAKVPEGMCDGTTFDHIEILSNFSKARAMVSMDGEQVKISDLFAGAGHPLPSLRFMPSAQVKRQQSEMAGEREPLAGSGVVAPPSQKSPKIETGPAPTTPKLPPAKASGVKASHDEQEPVSPADEAAGMAPPVKPPPMGPVKGVKAEGDQDALASEEAGFQPMVS